MLRNALRTVARRLQNQEHVGSDAAGNHYLRQQVNDDSGEPRERRWVESPEKERNFYEAELIPPEWHQWLRHGRQVICSLAAACGGCLQPSGLQRALGRV